MHGHNRGGFGLKSLSELFAIGMLCLYTFSLHVIDINKPLCSTNVLILA